MKPVFQTISKVPGGNCLQACIASVLEMRIEDVPDVVNLEAPTNWLERLSAWLHPQGLYAVYEPLKHGVCNALIDGFCILGVTLDPPGSAEHPEWIHAVVGNASITENGMRFDVEHDPLLNPRTIVEIKDALFIVRKAT